MKMHFSIKWNKKREKTIDIHLYTFKLLLFRLKDENKRKEIHFFSVSNEKNRTSCWNLYDYNLKKI